MSGSWADAVADQARTCGRPEYLVSHMWDRYRKRRQTGELVRVGLKPITTMGTSQREAYEQGARDVLALQRGWFDLPAADAIWELRRGDASVFEPVFADGTDNPTITVECPSGRTHNPGLQVITDRQGMCSQCGYDLVDGPLNTEGDS